MTTVGERLRLWRKMFLGLPFLATSGTGAIPARPTPLETPLLRRA